MSLFLGVPRAVFHCVDPVRQTILVSWLSYSITRTSFSNINMCYLGKCRIFSVYLAPLGIKTQTLAVTKFVHIALEIVSYAVANVNLLKVAIISWGYGSYRDTT